MPSDDPFRICSCAPTQTCPRPIAQSKLEEQIRIVQETYQRIVDELTNRPPEFGGMLLGPINSDIVSHFVPDERAQATPASFTLHAESLNRRLRRFNRCGMDAKGLVHSHPSGVTRPSAGDLNYVRTSLANPKNKDCLEFLMPIVCAGQFYPYIIFRDRGVLRAELVLL